MKGFSLDWTTRQWLDGGSARLFILRYGALARSGPRERAALAWIASAKGESSVSKPL